MSLHKSLKVRNKLKRQRNVLTRFERLLRLEKEGGRSPEDSIFGLPKVRVEVAAKRGKGKKKKKEEEEATDAVAKEETP